MATKPTSSTFSCATDATFSSGDAAGQTTKTALATPAQGIVPGTAVEARQLNYMFNFAGLWSVWLDAGSSSNTDASAHIVETDSSGHARAVAGVFGSGSNSDYSLNLTNDSATGTAVSQQFGSGPAYYGWRNDTGGSAVFEADYGNTGQVGYNATVDTSGSVGYQAAASAANSVCVDVTSSVASRGAIESETTAAGYAVYGLSTHASGLGVYAQNTATGGTAFQSQSSTGNGVQLLANTTKGCGVIGALTATPSSPDDGSFYYRSDLESFVFVVDSSVYAAEVPYILHKSRNGNFFAADQDNAVNALGAIGASYNTIQTLTLNVDQAPRVAAASVIRAEFDVSTGTTNATAQIDVRIRDTTAGATVHTASGYTCSRIANGVVRISLTAEYAIPAAGARSFLVEIQDSAASGDSITVRNTYLEVRDAGI